MAFKLELTAGPLGCKVKAVPSSKSDDDTDTSTVCIGKDVCKDGCAQDHKHVPAHPAAPVNQKMRCSHCGREESSHWPYPRGKKNSDGTWAVISRTGLDVDDEDTKTQLTLVTASWEEVDELGIPNGKFYWLAFDGGKPEVYRALRDKIAAGKRAVISQWSPRSASKPVLLMVRGGVIGMQQLGWPQDITGKPSMDDVDAAEYSERTSQFLDLILDEDLLIHYNPETFRDTRRDKIAAVLAAATPVAGTEPVAATPVGGPADLEAQLEAYLAARGKTVSGAGKNGTKKATKKVADTPPVQPLPDELPPNVKVVTPRKRAAKKTAPAVKKTA